MAQRLSRAVLALLCAVAVVYGTAMFPAAFDVELGSDQPDVTSGPSGPAEVTEQRPSEGGPSSETESSPGSPGDSGTERSTPTSTSPVESTRTPVPTDSSGDGGNGNGGALTQFLGLFLFAGASVAFVVFLGFLAAPGDGSRSPFSALRLPSLAATLSLPSVSLRRIPQLTTLMIVTAGGGLARIADDAATVVDALVKSLGVGVGPVAASLGRSLVALPRTAGALIAAPVRALGTGAALFGGLGFLRGGLSPPSFGSADTPSRDARAGEPSPETGDESEPIASVVDAWTAMTDLVRVRRHESTTAAEYARIAIDAGLPAPPVERLTALFQEVRYGGRSDSNDRVAAARRALDALTGGED